MTLICEKNISAEVRLIHVEQVSLYNLIVLRKNNSQERHFKSMGIHWFS